MKAEVRSIEDSFSQGRGNNLYLGTYENLSFVQCENGLENYLIVPSGERLTVKVGLHIIVDEDRSWQIANIESATIEVIT